MVVGSFSELVLSIVVSKIVSKFVPPSSNETAIESTADKIINCWGGRAKAHKIIRTQNYFTITWTESLTTWRCGLVFLVREISDMSSEGCI